MKSEVESNLMAKEEAQMKAEKEEARLKAAEESNCMAEEEVAEIVHTHLLAWMMIYKMLL